MPPATPVAPTDDDIDAWTAHAIATAGRESDVAVSAAVHAVALARGHGTARQLVQALVAAVVALRHASNLVGSAEAGAEALQHLRDLPQPDAALEGRARNQYGSTLSYMGRTAEALQLFEESRALSMQAGRMDEVAAALSNTAIAADTLGDNDKARAMFKEALALHRAEGNQRYVAQMLNNLAFAGLGAAKLSTSAGDPQSAKAHLLEALGLVDEALAILAQIDEPVMWPHCMHTRVGVLRALGDLPAAIETLKSQLGHAQRFGTVLVADALATLGELQCELRQWPEAIDNLRQADTVLNETQNVVGHTEVLQTLTHALSAVGRHEEALATFRRCHEMELRLRDRDAQTHLHLVEAHLKQERTTAELALARQRESELTALNERLLSIDGEREELLRELGRESREDALTGLPNRRALEERLSLEVERGLRYGRELCVVLMDVDHFKRVNDEVSHAAGDRVLQTVANVLRNQVRATDMAARLGGDELVLLLPETELARAAQVCEQLRLGVAECDWHGLLPEGLRPTLSVGVVVSGVGATSQSLLADADFQLYRAKHAGRNRVRSVLDAG